jgi:acyl dehydratase
MIDPSAVGRTVPQYEKSWSPSDLILYALGVGSGTDELSYTTENSHDVTQRVLPTYGVVLAMPQRILSKLGDFPLRSLVHARHELRVRRPIPTEGRVMVSERVVSLADKGTGRHAVAVVAAVAVLSSGETLATCEMSVILRGQGGFGGEPGEAPATVEYPDRAPDWSIRQETWPSQPLLYRLCGDRNPLHSDPWFARRAGFKAPILHGLCTYGMAGRALLATVCEGDPSRLGRLAAQFSSPVMPGQGLVTEIWSTPAGAVFRVRAEPDGRVVVDNGEMGIGCTFPA